VERRYGVFVKSGKGGGTDFANLEVCRFFLQKQLFGHHYNWGFTISNIYKSDFQAT
jgi:hypothetical protein